MDTEKALPEQLLVAVSALSCTAMQLHVPLSVCYHAQHLQLLTNTYNC